MNIYTHELKTVFYKNSVLFLPEEISAIKQFFQIIEYYLFSKKEILYGLNYGKSFLNHAIFYEKKYFLLPSSDIFIGELGIDEGIIFAEYYLQYHHFLKPSYYPRKTVLIWMLLYCIEQFISNKILPKTNNLNVADLKSIVNEINNET